ncbi:MAG: hypothetical protein M1831_004718 [Alyxoria varia]|nr:MAG: hypothetical protein M1831_004718 [Alyxoria varia]
MAFTLRRPFAVTGALKQFSATSAPSTTTTFRATFHTSPPKQFIFKQGSSETSSIFNKTRQPIFQNAFRSKAGQAPTAKRTITQQVGPDASNLGQRLLYGGAIFGGTLLAINLVFNRETREDGGMPVYERQYLNQTFMHTGMGVGIIGLAARTLHMNGWSYRLMSASPWAVIGLGLAGSIGTMMATFYTSPENYVPKYAFWTGFNITQGALLAPLMFLQPALLARAGLYTAGVMGSIAFVGATAKQDKYLYLGGPLLAGVAVVALSGFAPLVVPATAARTLAVTENLWLYGGLVVFGGFTLYDVQKVLAHARLAQQGMVQKDVVNESISLELDFINLFVRMVQILGMQQRRK